MKPTASIRAQQGSNWLITNFFLQSAEDKQI